MFLVILGYYEVLNTIIKESNILIILTRVKSQICLMKHLNNGVFKILKTIKNKHQEIARNKK